MATSSNDGRKVTMNMFYVKSASPRTSFFIPHKGQQFCMPAEMAEVQQGKKHQTYEWKKWAQCSVKSGEEQQMEMVLLMKNISLFLQS